ncbi:MAG: sarcosine oxidase subunit gamma [Rhodobacteraceae bacterium]|nr:sarcosine oxidase subunit gamma [Paracoccaceae bacterium]
MSDPHTPMIAQIAQAPAQGMITLRGALSARKIAAAARAVAGVAMPGPLECRFDGARGIGWMSPDEALILLPRQDVAEALASLQKALVGVHATVVDVSDARAVFRVTGPHAREVLAKLSPADLSPAAFGPGAMRRTRLAQVPVAIWAEGDGAFSLICFRSVAVYVGALLAEAAQPGGAVGYFPSGA